MKYYLFTVQYNKEKKAENRPQPKAFDNMFDAEAAFHSQVAEDMKNKTLGGSVNKILNDMGSEYEGLTKRWGYIEEPAEPTPIEPTAE